MMNLLFSLMMSSPILADVPAIPWPTEEPAPEPGWFSGPVPILAIALVVVAASVVLWRVIRSDKAK